MVRYSAMAFLYSENGRLSWIQIKQPPGDFPQAVYIMGVFSLLYFSVLSLVYTSPAGEQFATIYQRVHHKGRNTCGNHIKHGMLF